LIRQNLCAAPQIVFWLQDGPGGIVRLQGAVRLPFEVASVTLLAPSPRYALTSRLLHRASQLRARRGEREPWDPERLRPQQAPGRSKPRTRGCRSRSCSKNAGRIGGRLEALVTSAFHFGGDCSTIRSQSGFQGVPPTRLSSCRLEWEE